MKSSSIRIHDVFLSHPDSCSGQFRSGWVKKMQRNLRKTSNKFKKTIEIPRNSKKIIVLSPKWTFFVQKWTNPEMPKGTPTQVGMPKIHPHKPKDTPTQAATDPLRGSNHGWHKWVSWAICNGSTTWIQPGWHKWMS